MQATRLEKYRDRLIDERRAFVHQRELNLNAIPDDVHPAGEHTIAPSEGVDVEMSLDEEETLRIREIDAALERLRDGTYGKCGQCGREISASRLGAVPWATYCVRCETERQRE